MSKEGSGINSATIGSDLARSLNWQHDRITTVTVGRQPSFRSFPPGTSRHCLEPGIPVPLAAIGKHEGRVDGTVAISLESRRRDCELPRRALHQREPSKGQRNRAKDNHACSGCDQRVGILTTGRSACNPSRSRASGGRNQAWDGRSQEAGDRWQAD